MWEFLTQVLETGGFVALSYAVLVLTGGFIIRSLWKDNKELRAEVSNLQTVHSDKLNAVQEKRIDETRQVVEQVMTHASNVDKAVDRMDSALNALITSMRS